MKKFFSLLLCVLLLCACFSACSGGEEAADLPEQLQEQSRDQSDGSTQKPLRLCADFGIGKILNPPGGQEFALETFLKSVADRGGPTDVEIELIPSEGSERQTALNRIRVELMSGQGPDIFLCNCGYLGFMTDEQALFQFPEQAMKRGMFLKLDDYIENAQFMEWDKLTSIVMDAGKTEDGQYLLPLGYSFPLSIFLSDDVQPYPADTTWAQVAEGDDPVLSTTMDPILSSDFYLLSESDYFSYTWAKLADYDSETLLISEEEMLQRAKEVLFLQEDGADSPFHYFNGIMDRDLFTTNISFDATMNELRQGITRNDALTMVPLYCDQGGAVAAIHTFAGINAATERPEDAFFVLDVLMSGEIQKNLALYEIWTHDEMTVHEGVSFGQPENVLSAFEEARSQLTSARFVTSLDAYINDVLLEYKWLAQNGEVTEETLSELVSEAYSGMKKALDES